MLSALSQLRLLGAVAGADSAATDYKALVCLFLAGGNDAKTAPVAIVGFMTNKEIYWGRMAAAGSVVLIPVLAFGIVAHRHLVRGLVSGSGR